MYAHCYWGVMACSYSQQSSFSRIWSSRYFCSPDIVTGPSSLLFLPLPQRHGVLSFPPAAVGFSLVYYKHLCLLPFSLQIKVFIPWEKFGERGAGGILGPSFSSSFILHHSSLILQQLPVPSPHLDTFLGLFPIFSASVQ